MAFSIPSVTDNVYKFYAIFGLTLIVSSVIGSIQLNRMNNARIHQFAKDVEAVHQRDPEFANAKDSPVVASALKQIEVIGEDRKGFKRLLLGLVAVGAGISFYGFRQWQNGVQKMDDAIKELELKKLKLEVEKLKGQ
ncbi:hypothetical protein ACFPK9_07955 [Rubritalea spongiae]|uniref:Transmembrane protein n=1 Tax=Rubritalea spongiae TaxID=430797 RepID=A0ABW5E2Y9_9BACT